VLKALLPDTGTDLKGHMRSHHDLLAASGYAARPRDFDALLRILDGEPRLITPTEPAASGGWGTRASGSAPGDSSNRGVDTPRSPARYYQLTHDYLVHSLRDWLTRKQKDTRRGRAELRLTERAAFWHAQPENRHLPAWRERATIRLFTRPEQGTQSQAQMIRREPRVPA